MAARVDRHREAAILCRCIFAGDVCAGLQVIMPAESVEQATLLAALQELDVSLDELQGLFDNEDGRARLALRGLEEDDEDLVRLEEMLSVWRNEVDTFDALRLHGDEQFHSNFLAWLLDPRGSHELGDHFLRGLLAASGVSGAISAANRPSTTVCREYYLEHERESGRLDIRILNENANFVCAVENKVEASESGDQLARYRRVLAHHYPRHRVHLVFLTPQGVMPEDPAEREHWTTMSYTDVLRLVEGTIAANGDLANEDVMAFLRQYTITLRRNIVPEVSNDVHELARRIYLKHKRAIDLIIEYRERYEPNYVTEGFRMIREGIGQHPLWREARCDRPYARFVPPDWDEYEELRLDDWPYSLLLFEVRVTDRWAECFLTLCRGGDESLRQVIFERVRDHLEVFNCEQAVYADQAVRLHTMGNILEGGDYENWWDTGRIRDTIRARLDEFSQGEFSEINRIILECLEEYRSESR